MLLGLAKAVANSTAALVLKAKNVASTCETEEQQNRVIGAATQCALTTSQLVAIAKVRDCDLVCVRIGMSAAECWGTRYGSNAKMDIRVSETFVMLVMGMSSLLALSVIIEAT